MLNIVKDTPLEKYLIVNNETDIIEIKEKIELCMKEKEEVLNTGDTIYFDGRSSHALTALGGKSCKFLSIVMHTNVETDEPKIYGGMVYGQNKRHTPLYARLCHHYRPYCRFLHRDTRRPRRHPFAYARGGLRECLYV